MSSVIIAPIGQSVAQFLANHSYSKIVVIADSHTKRHCYPILKQHLPKHHLISFAAGENHKNLTTCTQIWSEMTRLQLDRQALVLNLGGGVVGDMGGFCASTYKRGIDFVQIPTTLLSQVDASVGGKLGIDFEGFKNHIGTFTLPQAVFIDAVFLETLPINELRSGFAEVIKHCLIADADKWHEIRIKDFEEQNWPDLIGHSVEIKKKIVTQDPTEKNIRKILNFGHTLGHAIETYFLSKPAKQQLLHGEAIAVGMLMETYIAYRKKMIDLQTLEQLEAFIFAIYGQVNIKNSDTAAIIQLTQQDKKNLNGQLRFATLTAAGQCAYDVIVTPDEIKKAVAYYTAEV
jgi:3-dehydroquinate synthase